MLFDSYTVEILKDGFFERNCLCFLSYYTILPYVCEGSNKLCGLYYNFLKTTVY